MNQKGFANIVLVAVIVMLVGVVGYFALTSNKKSAINTEVLNSAENTNNISTGTNSTTDITAGWKTYTSDKFGFSVKHPADWKVATETSADATATYLKSPDGTEYVYFFPRGEFDAGPPTNKRTEKATLGGKSATRRIYWDTDANNPMFCFYEFLTAPADNWIAPDAEGKNGNRVQTACTESSIVKTILSTFTFTK